MRYSKVFGRTIREKPRNADSDSLQLLLRAGFVRQAGGDFLLLPIGRRVMARIEALVDAELTAAGAGMLGIPSGDQAGNSDLARSLRMQRRDAGIDYPFAAAHESTLAMLGGSLTLSYRDLPVVVAGLRWANRENARPNWGLLASPNFPFHSAYAFGGALEPVAAAYRRVLERMDVGAFSMESGSHSGSTEFAIETALASRPILACEHCGYRAPAELAVSRVPEWPQNPEPGAAEAVYGPGLIQVEPLAKFLGIPVHQTTKTILFETGGRVVAACVAGVYSVSEAKLMRVLGSRRLALAAPETVRELTHAEVGYAGPAGLPETVEVIWDLSTEHRSNFEAGANRTDHHCINLNFGRDVPRPAGFFDIRESLASERCARCDAGVLAARGAMVLGHASDLGDFYADLLGARFIDDAKTTHPLSTACAGLDLACTLAAIVERHHDDHGIVWPKVVAPFAAHLVSLPSAEEASEALYRQLVDAGVEVLWDDRAESAGVKFADADLIGIPVRLVLSKRTAGRVEWKERGAASGELIDSEEVLKRLGCGSV